MTTEFEPTIAATRALFQKQIADLRAKPLYFGFVVAGVRDYSPVYEAQNRFQLFSGVVAILTAPQARKVAANFNRQIADSGLDLQSYRFMPYEKWAPARIAILQSTLDKLATLD